MILFSLASVNTQPLATLVRLLDASTGVGQSVLCRAPPYAKNLTATYIPIHNSQVHCLLVDLNSLDDVVLRGFTSILVTLDAMGLDLIPVSTIIPVLNAY